MSERPGPLMASAANPIAHRPHDEQLEFYAGDVKDPTAKCKEDLLKSMHYIGEIGHSVNRMKREL